MVATVVDGGADDDSGKPEPHDREVRPCDDRTRNDWSKVNERVLKGMTVD